jgi:hypothetical protein
MKKMCVIILGVAAFAAVPALVMAQSAEGLTPYAQIRAWTGYVKQSKDLTGTTKADTDYSSRLGASRFGVKGKTGDLEGVVEMGLDGVNDDSAKNVKVSTRKIYGIWNMSNDIKFMFGQDEAPYTFYSNSYSNDDTFSGFGATNQSRDFQLKVMMYGFYIDFLNPTTKTPIAGYGSATAPSMNTDVMFPKIALGYDYKMETEDKSLSLLVSPGFAYQSLKLDKATDPRDGKKVNSMLAYCHATVKMGGFSVLANFGYGVNTGNMGLDYSKSFASAQSSISTAKPYIVPVAEASGNSIKNTKTIEGFIDAGYDFGAAEVRGGVGYAQAKNPNWSKTDKQMAYYAQLSIPLIPKKLYIKPEIEYRNFMKDKAGVKQGNELLAGIFFHAFL